MFLFPVLVQSPRKKQWMDRQGFCRIIWFKNAQSRLEWSYGEKSTKCCSFVLIGVSSIAAVCNAGFLSWKWDKMRKWCSCISNNYWAFLSFFVRIFIESPSKYLFSIDYCINKLTVFWWTGKEWFFPLKIPVGFLSVISHLTKWFLVLSVIIVSSNLVDTELKLEGL